MAASRCGARGSRSSRGVMLKFIIGEKSQYKQGRWLKQGV
jgi:hypothetical protein